MGVPTSEVGYTSATTGWRDHEVRKGHVVALEKKHLHLYDRKIRVGFPAEAQLRPIVPLKRHDRFGTFLHKTIASRLGGALTVVTTSRVVQVE
jgi:hypothetical protein